MAHSLLEVMRKQVPKLGQLQAEFRESLGPFDECVIAYLSISAKPFSPSTLYFLGRPGWTGGSSIQTQDLKTVRGKSLATGLHCPQAKELLEALTDAVRELVL